MNAMRQIALPFPETLLYPPGSFVPGAANETALALLEAPQSWPHWRLAVWGEGGCGKTHFLHHAADRLGAALLPAAALRAGYEPPAAPLALDDADAADPRALLHAINWCAEQQRPLILASRLPPSRLATGLADLDSRLAASLACEITLPDDTLLAAQLRRHAIARQLAIPPEVETFLLTRLPRRGDVLREVIARLDHAALAAGRRITRPLAAQVLAGLGYLEEETMTQASYLPPSQDGVGLL